MKRIGTLFLLVLTLMMVMAMGLSAKPVDHSKFGELQRNFGGPEDVTRTCLGCHNLAGQEIMKTSHWLWSKETDKYPGKNGKVAVGKRNVINNFYPGIVSNESSCTSCHIGYGWRDSSFNFSDENKIDCLVCHDRTGSYKKAPDAAGYPVNGVNYSASAKSVGKPGRDNCGQCHFNACDGNAQKHGDLDRALMDVSRDVDVHMSNTGGKMDCVDCHVTQKHDVKGRLLSTAVESRDRVGCEQCHTSNPHTQKLFIEKFQAKGEDGHYDIMGYKSKLYIRNTPENSFINRILDKHYKKVSCQACHIDVYASSEKTKLMWDWSRAGQKADKNAKAGDVVMDPKKGEIKLGGKLVPDYALIGGNVGHVLYGDKIDPSKAPIQLTTFHEAELDGKIWPVKIMKGKQLYDTENKTLIVPKLFGPRGSGAYFADGDWKKAASAGMNAAGLDFSGKYDWVTTEMVIPVNHQVLPKDKSLRCEACHSRDGRLENVKAGWVPGRDRSLFLDIVGILALLGALGMAAGHGYMRYKSFAKKGE